MTSALDMPEIMSYIYSKSWKLQFSASSSIIIIEDYYLQTFLHSLITPNTKFVYSLKRAPWDSFFLHFRFYPVIWKTNYNPYSLYSFSRYSLSSEALSASEYFLFFKRIFISIPKRFSPIFSPCSLPIFFPFFSPCSLA